MMSLTFLFCCVKEIPKSPLNMLLMKMRYCSGPDLSRPYFFSRFARISAVTALSFISGSPGTECIAINVAVAINQTVTIPANNLFSVYANNIVLLDYSGTSKIRVCAHDPAHDTLNFRMHEVNNTLFILWNDDRIFSENPL